MKTLSNNFTSFQATEFVSYNNTLYKIKNEVGDAYCKVFVYSLSKNGEFTLLASFYEIPQLKHISFRADTELKIAQMKENIKICKDWIKKVFKDITLA